MNLTLLGGGAVATHAMDSTTDKRHPLGTIAIDNFGRTYRYAQVGAVASVAGSLYQAAAPIANHLANTPPAVATGATSFTSTPGATAGRETPYEAGS